MTRITARAGPTGPHAAGPPLDVDLELLFDSPVTFTADDNPMALVSLTIDLSGWFSKDGGTLDPTDPANRSPVEANIQKSLELRSDN